MNTETRKEGPMKTIQRIAIGLSIVAVALSFAGTAFASSIDTWRWNKTHAIKTWAWADGDVQTDGTATYVVHFRVKNVDTKAVSGSCVVKSVVYAGPGGPDDYVYHFKHTFSFAVKPGKTAPDQTYTVGPFNLYPGWGYDTDDWTASCTSGGKTIRA
jgi:hypothetical protein